MSKRLQRLSETELDLLHSSAMSILSRTGVVFHHDKALRIFSNHGVRTEGSKVFPTETEILSALNQVPRSFTIEARDPAKSIVVGGHGQAPLAPGYGAPFVADLDGAQRPATHQDYENFCKLSHTSKVIDLNGFMAVEPQDLPAPTAYLDMILATMLLSDKPFLSCPLSAQALDDNIQMANILS
jgi:trimethylamine---corrinoid protein Co-methyltransferase